MLSKTVVVFSTFQNTENWIM